MNRRQFFGSVAAKASQASPAIALAAGTRFKPYKIPNGAWRGWVECWGKVIGFVRLDGSFFPCVC